MSFELEFIELLKQRFAAGPPVQFGIGDDGAVIAPADGGHTVVVTDMLLDGVHFDLAQTDPALVGRKSIAVNLSDLAAMGSRPVAGFVSIAVPSDVADAPGGFVSSLFTGIEQLADHYRFTVAGGDTNVWNGPLAINVCLMGELMGAQPVLRSGANVGDVLVVTGPLGGSLHSGRHLTFEPRLDLAEQLVESGELTAMMDISDGLALDLHRMMKASGAGAVVNAESIPVHTDVPVTLSDEKRREAALSDGEDFELLLTVLPDAVTSLLSAHPMCCAIGEVSPGSEVFLRAGGSEVPLPAVGWQHDGIRAV